MSTVTRLERTRLLEAMLEELTEKGYPEVEVEAAARRAHLIGEDWVTQFPDKDACLLAAFEELTDRLRVSIGKGCASGKDWPAQVAGGLGALLAELSRRAPLAEALVRTFPSIGPPAQARYQAFVEGLAPLLSGGRAFSTIGAELPGELEMLAVGAAEALVFEQIRSGEAERLASSEPALLFSLLVPFLGSAQATAEVERARTRCDI